MLQSFQPLHKSEEVWKIRNFGKDKGCGRLHICIRVYKSYKMGEFHLTCYLVQIHPNLYISYALALLKIEGENHVLVQGKDGTNLSN